MTVHNAIQWLEVIAALYDGTAQRGEQIVLLSRELVERPETFAETFFETLNEGDPVRKKAMRLIQSGVITASTTFAEAATILEGTDAE